MSKMIEYVEPSLYGEFAYVALGIDGRLCRPHAAPRRKAMVRDDYAADEINANRGWVEETAVNVEQWSLPDHWEPGSLDALIGRLQEFREMVPEEFRSKACCEVESVGGYEGEHHAEIKVTYRRPETDAEVVAHLQRAEAEKKWRVEDLERQLARARGG